MGCFHVMFQRELISIASIAWTTLEPFFLMNVFNMTVYVSLVVKLFTTNRTVASISFLMNNFLMFIKINRRCKPLWAKLTLEFFFFVLSLIRTFTWLLIWLFFFFEYFVGFGHVHCQKIRTFVNFAAMFAFLRSFGIFIARFSKLWVEIFQVDEQTWFGGKLFQAALTLESLFFRCQTLKYLLLWVST